ncbi:NADPH-dependent methylglyoxal reductase Gre2p [[Candida] railenensis]|uniref:NADPH-dependent methylglyoxal reductase Gre2p n=1 Tax=[Candida] railenensis TaxID=45579 RepID=A0A9P0VWP1_9ASCO|nr:NADPH-dependent methylglyoxal reductase Gre2p [[Candida] railenensis]
MAETVIITGASGFIAQHIVKQLLQKGYKVVGTVRSKGKGEKLKKSFDSISPNFTYEIVPDIGKKDGLKELLLKHREAEILLHTASPFHFNTDDPEKDLLLPAKNGTLYTLQAIKDYAPQIRKVVVTSSYAAVSLPKRENDPTFTINETTWNNVQWYQAKKNAFFGYFGSKKFAEKAVWDFKEENEGQLKFTLNVVNPSYVFGPQAFDSEAAGKDTLNTSSEIINSIVKLTAGKDDDSIPSQSGSFIDVRDVARAHIAAIENDAIVNERLLLASDRFSTQSILDVINRNFKNELNVPVGVPGSENDILESFCKIDNSRTKRLLGFSFTSFEDSVRDSVSQIVRVRALKGKL